MIDKAKIGFNIKMFRTKFNLTQEELGKKINKEGSDISRYESGDRIPRLETTKKMAELFEVTIDCLINKTWE